VLASGGGSNMQAVLDHFARLGNARGGDVVVVASDRAAAGALTRARGAGIAAEALASPSDAAELKSLLERHAVDMIALAGYLKLVPREVVARYEQRIVNVHPALLPAFGGPGMYGRRVHQAVLDSGATVSGATVHFADQEYDHGKIIAMAGAGAAGRRRRLPRRAGAARGTSAVPARARRARRRAHHSFIMPTPVVRGRRRLYAATE